MAVIFSDVNLGFITQSQYELAYDEQSIQNSITMILGTKVGSRVFNRSFGSNVEDLLFNPMDDITVTALKTEVIRAISKWEPRINLTSVVVKPDYANEQYFVRMEYKIPALAGKTFSFVFNLNRGG